MTTTSRLAVGALAGAAALLAATGCGGDAAPTGGTPAAGTAGDATPAATPKAYPLDTCIVSGEKLGEMGEPYVFTHEGQEIKLCCKKCLKDFEAEPAKFLAKLKP